MHHFGQGRFTTYCFSTKTREMSAKLAPWLMRSVLRCVGIFANSTGSSMGTRNGVGAAKGMLRNDQDDTSNKKAK